MHVIVVTDDVLYPTNSGGRSALLGECEALVAAGCELTLVVSHRNKLSAHEVSQHEKLASRVVFIQRSGFAATTMAHPLRPFQMQSRKTVLREMALGLGREDTVGVIASHEWTIPLAKSIAGPLGLRVALRSHNDEVAYMQALARSASGLRRAYCWAEAVRLRIMLKELYRDIAAVAVLSEGDSDSYRPFGLTPTFVPAVLFRDHDANGSAANIPPESARLLFVGALDMPQAVEGLKWFCSRVLPLVRAAVPHAELHVAGRRPNREIAQLLSAMDGVEFHGEVSSLEPLYAATRIFVNPVFSGSGVNMKVGPPAVRGIPVVTTTTGARGLSHLAPGFVIADDEEEFAAGCIRLLEDNDMWSQKSGDLSTRAGLISSPSIARGLLELFDETRV
ncbi:hypothetical protein Arth_3201 [Arthrobacter sp. FB24]|uniref:glycosyltransferase n=1 Tax=Arthrobacter sp. (strain FB24) TaxID=290399 RepID=UPI0000527350|nr:hypothetical protein Arth_3201 [Arthrobacter sp. FB24]